MWGYRLPAADRTILLTWPTSTIRTRLQKHQYDVVDRAPLDIFERELKHANQIAKALGWDGTFVREPDVFSLPVPDSEMAWGFIITQATSGQRFVTSPVPMRYLDDLVDWDAKISDEEVMKIRGQLTGEVEPEPEVYVGDWKRSRKGNMYTEINGTNVTIISNRNGVGYKAVIPIHADPSKNIYTKSFKTELEVASYVVENFNTLIASLRREGGIDASNPLAGVDWGDDEPDIPF